jgi:hypothetical protein
MPKLPAKAFQSEEGFFVADAGESGGFGRLILAGTGLGAGGGEGGVTSRGSRPNSSASDFHGSSEGSVILIS